MDRRERHSPVLCFIESFWHSGGAAPTFFVAFYACADATNPSIPQLRHDMARFTGEYKESLTVNAPLEVTKKHFSSLDVIVTNYVDLDHADRVSPNTLHFHIVERNQKGVHFKAQFRCLYEFTEEDVFSWRTVGDGNNMRNTGRLVFVSRGAEATELEWWNRIELEIPVNRLLGKMIGPIVSREIRQGSRKHFHNLVASFPHGRASRG